eukprot:3875219-Pleurochrysis_carterae.AAC.7
MGGRGARRDRQPRRKRELEVHRSLRVAQHSLSRQTDLGLQAQGSGVALKARLCVQGCAQVHGVDCDQTFCATMRPTSLRALAAIANAAGMRMRSWDFVAAYLQGDLEQNEVVYCHAPPGYATLGADGRPRICRVEKPIYGMAQAGRRWQR